MYFVRKLYEGLEECTSLTVEDTGDFAKKGTDPLGSLGDLDVEEFLHGEGVAEFVRH